MLELLKHSMHAYLITFLGDHIYRKHMRMCKLCVVICAFGPSYHFLFVFFFFAYFLLMLV